MVVSQDDFGSIYGAAIFCTRSATSLGGLAKMFYPRRRTWSGTKCCWTVFVMNVMWRKSL